MSSTYFCKSFIDEILTLYQGKTLYISLVNNGATSLGTSIINKSEIDSFIIEGTEKAIEQTTISETQLNANNIIWENVTFDVRYAIVYDDSGLVIFFIDFESVKSLNNDNFEIDWTEGFIKIG